MTRQTLNHGDSSNFFLDRKFEQKIGLSQPLIYDVFQIFWCFVAKLIGTPRSNSTIIFPTTTEHHPKSILRLVYIDKFSILRIGFFPTKKPIAKKLASGQKNIGTFKAWRELDIDVSSSTNKGGIFCFHQFLLGGFFHPLEEGGKKTTNSWTPSWNMDGYHTELVRNAWWWWHCQVEMSSGDDENCQVKSLLKVKEVSNPFCGWWNFKYVLFSTRNLGETHPSNLMVAFFFKWVVETTN